MNSKLIIVDDDNSVVDVIESLSAEQDWEVRTFGGADTIVDEIRHWKPDLLLLNVNICDFITIRKIKSNFVDLPIIFINDSKIDDAILRLIQDSSDDSLSKPFQSSELYARVRIQLKIKDLKSQLAKIRDSGEIDGVTGLFALRSVVSRLEHELLRGKRFNRSVCVVLLEYDALPQALLDADPLANTFVIGELAKLIRSSIRNIDLVGRYSKTGFIIVLTEVFKQGASIFCERMRVKIENFEFKRHSQIYKLTSSIGFAISNPAEPDIETHHIMDIATLALADAKSKGGNSFCCYDISEKSELLKKRAI